MRRSTISRRAMLRGAGGAALALPALEIMRGSGKAAAAGGDCPRRYVVCYFGTSVASCYRVGNYPGGRYDYVTPTRTGPNYEETIGLKPIFEEGVQSDMGLVSGLKIPFAGKTGPHTIPAGVGVGFHVRSNWPQLCGTADFAGNDENPTGASSDQLILSTISGDTLTRFPRGLPLCVSPLFDQTISYQAPQPSFGKDTYGRAMGRAVRAYTSPKEVYDALFGTAAALGGTPSEDTLKRLVRRKGILHAVKERANVLIGRLGRGDKARMERYFEHVSALEKRVQGIDPTMLPKCDLPDPIVSDPKTGHYYSQASDKTEIYDTESGWADETERARLQKDLIAHAFQCDQTRVASWIFDGAQSNINMYPIAGYRDMLHAVTHGYSDTFTPQMMAKAIAWYVRPVAQLVKYLKEADDICGGKIIDNTVIVMLLEGGHGRSVDESVVSDPTNKDYESGLRYAHSLENMIAVVAGGRSLGLQPGQHINCDNKKHPAEVIYTALNALGLNGRYGEISTDIPQMRSLQP